MCVISATNVFTITPRNYEISFRNGTKIKNDAAAQIKDSRTYLPIRAVAEALDATVSWDGNVIITTNAAGNLIHSIENSGKHVSNVWKKWEAALATNDLLDRKEEILAAPLLER